MGQKRHVQVFLLVTEETIEEQMLKTISAKHDLALAALDVGSDVNEVMMTSGVEELKRRLEVLLGSKPAAPVDNSMLNSPTVLPQETTITQTQDQDYDKSQEPIAQAGNDVLQSLFHFTNVLFETLSPKSETQTGTQPETPTTANTISEQILPNIQKTVAKAVRVESDAEGNTRLSFTLPERPVLEGLLQNAAQLLNSFITPK
jgi:hypothetical protein